MLADSRVLLFIFELELRIGDFIGQKQNLIANLHNRGTDSFVPHTAIRIITLRFLRIICSKHALIEHFDKIKDDLFTNTESI